MYDIQLIQSLSPSLPPLQGYKSSGGPAAVIANVAKIKAEAEKLDLMDKAAGILAELLYTDQMISEIKEYRLVLLHVSIYRIFC